MKQRSYASVMQENLFASNPKQPLAFRLRPKNFDEFSGQEHLVGSGKFLTEILKSDSLPSLILWGPPGSGKTTLALLIAKAKDYEAEILSAVTSGIKDVKDVVERAEKNRGWGKKTLLFLDEIHRFNKSQQDYLLPHVESGLLTLIGATTENPSFSVISPLLSRSRVLVLNRLEEKDLKTVLDRAVADLKITLEPETSKALCSQAEGDARRMLTTLETAASLARDGLVTVAILEEALQKKTLPHDKHGEEHYNLISSFIKSMRGSDPDAAVYYLARLLEAGEDPLFLARRMVIFASEDIGNADPQALVIAMAAMQSYDFVGMPEGWIPLAQSATYLASAPKSNASYMAYQFAKADVIEHGALPTPTHLRNAVTKLLKEIGYGKGYQYAHHADDGIIAQDHLPDKLKGKKYYEPKGIGYEKKLMEWLDLVAQKKNAKK